MSWLRTSLKTELFVFALQFEHGAVASWSCSQKNALIFVGLGLRDDYSDGL